MPTIYIRPTDQNSYLKVSYHTQSGKSNLGILQHRINSGTLNVKEELNKIIEKSTNSPLKYMPFIASQNPTRDHGGIGYVGYYICENLPQAVELLRIAVEDNGDTLNL